MVYKSLKTFPVTFAKFIEVGTLGWHADRQICRCRWLLGRAASTAQLRRLCQSWTSGRTDGRPVGTSYKSFCWGRRRVATKTVDVPWKTGQSTTIAHDDTAAAHADSTHYSKK